MNRFTHGPGCEKAPTIRALILLLTEINCDSNKFNLTKFNLVDAGTKELKFRNVDNSGVGGKHTTAIKYSLGKIFPSGS